jgi:two-component system, OmpR family, alkaline phosphatase synthesis response regulator PhoP
MRNKVLIIEDEKNLVELLKINFEVACFDVIVADDGESGILKAETESPDVVIVDIRLPIVNGWDVCKFIKNNDKTSKIPVVILTAAAQRSDYIRSKTVGCDMYITKPFDPIEVVENVIKIINKKID